MGVITTRMMWPPATVTKRRTAREAHAATGAALWHARLGSPVTNGPITYELDGLQYVVVGAGPSLVAFVMNQ